MLPLQPGMGQDAGDSAAERFTSYADRQARSYQFAFTDGDGRPFELLSEAIQVWTNPVTGSIRGRVYLWTHGGVPQVIVSIYKFDEKTWIASEFHALARDPFTGKSSTGEEWRLKSPLEFETVSGASAPSNARETRLRQMRSIARQFSAERLDRDGTTWNLRLLSQPLYRYPEDAATEQDGAIFAFVQGTNPDVILVIETQTRGGVSTWQYALARMHRYQLNVRLGGTPLRTFRVLQEAELFDRSQQYTVFRDEVSDMAEQSTLK